MEDQTLRYHHSGYQISEHPLSADFTYIDPNGADVMIHVRQAITDEGPQESLGAFLKNVKSVPLWLAENGFAPVQNRQVIQWNRLEVEAIGEISMEPGEIEIIPDFSACIGTPPPLERTSDDFLQDTDLPVDDVSAFDVPEEDVTVVYPHDPKFCHYHKAPMAGKDFQGTIVYDHKLDTGFYCGGNYCTTHNTTFRMKQNRGTREKFWSHTLKDENGVPLKDAAGKPRYCNAGGKA